MVISWVKLSAFEMERDYIRFFRPESANIARACTGEKIRLSGCLACKVNDVCLPQAPAGFSRAECASRLSRAWI